MGSRLSLPRRGPVNPTLPYYFSRPPAHRRSTTVVQDTILAGVFATFVHFGGRAAVEEWKRIEEQERLDEERKQREADAGEER
jgi:hypothetical protein